ncbi:hypothetical protein BU202_00105 [Streptococcus cuniculi]|uniref:SMI1/KNR4 family protein n=1 Tax=Streptococcus cuniculi TaxID=1432788 RepID=A0A1Q8EAB7_9STRE|nr:SMI1/KNR4 family protein [Streptococcus cuniculi]OLF48732.1 hypothetical protein BU202_00105 [Streptococcus cuniculi]
MSIITFEHSFFTYPQQIKSLISEGLVDFGAWYLMNDEQTSRRFEGLQTRYPDRRLYPFAKRDDNDDIACFDGSDNTTVHVIHDFANSGWEQKEIFPNIDAWLEYAEECNLQNESS